MIYKVYYQEIPGEVPVRERTSSMYVEANAEREVRAKLADKNVNIEFIQVLSEEHLEYEQKNEDYQVEQY
ncbi:DNA-dependent RNA polymerase subunit epsilon [Salimicrobium flavidum]|uniref:DNA-directed RNA polymerase subunit epsilon n=1 Tax=Salimicrobium flavidum TaxID=570947 RepID=A0A1N7IM49_9BACI|nr:DNA-directed RNA polymerase subunit epsilon [Salimicrobium flavidum]SIS38155.1 DNA-dependent RNA polymerase auxiliary subunit epsilon [Salimicrobium flavidum]